MNLASFLTIMLSVTVSAIGQICFKLGLNSLNRPDTPAQLEGSMLLASLLTPGVIVGLGFYIVGALLWLSALGRVELSQAYPFVGFGFTLTTLAGWWIFGDHLSVQRIAGIGIVLVGITFLAKT